MATVGLRVALAPAERHRFALLLAKVWAASGQNEWLLTTTCSLEVRAAIHRQSPTESADCRTFFQPVAKHTVDVEPACVRRAKERSLTQGFMDTPTTTHTFAIYIQILAES